MSNIKLSNSKLQFLAMMATVLLSLSGCGGGGGGGGASTTPSSPTSTATIPVAPGSLTAVPGDKQITLTWSAVSGATSYNLYWRTTTDVTVVNGIRISNTQSPYVHTLLTNGTTYKYIVTAVNSAGESPASAQVSAVPTGSYTIGGDVVGLESGQSLIMQNNGGDDLAVSANGTFTFNTPLHSADTYDVTIKTQPVNGQKCGITSNATLTSGSTGVGTVASSNINTVRVSCYSVSTFAGSGYPGLGDAAGEESAFSIPSGAAMDANGNLYVADVTTDVIRKITPNGVVTTLAGSIAGDRSQQSGYVDATGADARFNFTQSYVELVGVAVDSQANVYVADNGNNVIRKITPAGVVTTLAGSGVAGYYDGTGTAAQFNSPRGVAVDGQDNVYVGDTLNNVIRKITPAGVVTTFAGSVAGGYVDGTGFNAAFTNPQGVAADSAGNIYVADTGNNVIRKITPAGVVTTLAGKYGGYLDGTGTAAKLMGPQGIAVDAAGNVYITEYFYSYPDIGPRMITPQGVVSTLAGPGFGFADGSATVARFYYPQGIAVDTAGNIFVADGDNNRIRKISAKPYSYTVGGHVVGLASGASLVLQNNGGDDLMINQDGQFIFTTPLTDISSPTTYTVTVSTQPNGQSCIVTNGTGAFTQGDVLTVDVNCADVSTDVGSGTAGFVDATGSSAKFNSPSGMAMDSAGNLYVADINNYRVRKITPAGVVSTLAGDGTIGYRDGAANVAEFSFSGPTGLAVDASGNVYVADTDNNTIRKITPAGDVSTLAGAGPIQLLNNFADGTGTAALFSHPRGLALDGSGNLYVADAENNSIRKVTISNGVVTTLAGGGGFSNYGYINGTGSAARFYKPNGVSVDSAGNVYVADTSNHAIRKITAGGVVSTVAGSGYNQYGDYLDATGTAAELVSPISIGVDAAGNIYITDNSRVRVINAVGTVTTLAGSMTGSYGYQDGNGSSALFNFGCNTGSEAGMVVSGNTVFVADTCNHMIRKIVH